MIIAAMVTVAIPYATRSNKSLKIKQECLSLAQAVEYVADLATDTRRPTRIVVDVKNNCYLLEAATGVNNHNYRPIKDFGGGIRHFGESVHIIDMTGFSVDGNEHCLVFEPARPWPSASISLTSGDTIKTITIKGKQVEISEDSNIQEEGKPAQNFSQG